MASKAKTNTPGQHRATYARDKKNGGYIIRVQGPYCSRFAGREVPVLKKGETSSSGTETLTELIWSGQDDGNISGYSGPVALYHFAAKPRDGEDEIPF